MKTLYSKLIAILFLTLLTQKGISQSVTFQFYHDLNNNCNYDGGEPLLGNLQGYVTLNYVNISSNTVVVTNSLISCTNNVISVSSPSLPATNTLTFTLYSSASYPTFSINTSCSAYTNLSYTGTNYLPVKTISQNSNPNFYTNSTGFYSAYAGNTFPVCNNMANDSVNLYFNFDNIYSCASPGAVTASRTYSLYLDNILLDVAVTTGTGSSSVNGSSSKMTVFESYGLSSTNLYFRTLFGPGPLSTGNHLYELKSTPIYTTVISALNYSTTLNAVPCSSITGSIYEDCDNNCMKTSGDGSIYWGAMALIFNSTNTFSIYPDANGDFSGIVPTSASQYSITTLSTSPIFTPCPAASVTTAIVSISGYDFGYKSGVYVDPNIQGPFAQGTTNPGSIKNVNITCWNYPTTFGTTCAATFAVNPGKIKALLDKNFTYLNAVGTTPVPNSIVSGPNGDTLIWNVADLNFATTLYYVVSAQMASTVTIGTGYTNKAWVYPTTDGQLGNNFSVCTWTVGLPCDPNDKRSWASGIQPNGDIPLATTDLFYTINFQNVGTAPAINVKCADTLDVNLDWNTLQVISSSFPAQVQIDNVTGSTFFNFNGINLPDSTSNEPGSHGFVHYRIKLKPSIPVNTVIKNRAHNYFDFQPAVATNQTKNKLVNLTGINELEKVNSVFVAPNPVSDKVTISSREMIQSVSVFNNLGQQVLKQEVNNSQTQLDFSPLPNTIYFITIQYKDGSQITKKVVKN
mgnify:CR=1 FL=1